MPDLSLAFGGDLTVGPTGDLAVVLASVLTQQRVLRRLLTNPGDYLWQLNYGAGLGQFVGQPGAQAAINGIARSHVLREAAVASAPAPLVTSVAALDGSVTLTLRYADAVSGQTNLLSFTV